MLPPILRRLFTTPLGLALFVLAMLSLVSIAMHLSGGGVSSAIPTSWLGTGIGGAAQAGAAAKADSCRADDPNGVCLIDLNDTVTAPPPDFDLLDAPLPDSYAAYFPDKRLPSALRSPRLASLAEHLRAFLERPALSFAEGREANQAGCPLLLVNNLANPDSLNEHHAFWASVDSGEIVKRRAELVQYLADRITDGFNVLGADMGSGPVTRGIVLTGGNGDTVLRILNILKHLRRIGNTLPVEVVHYPEELNDPKYRKLVEAQGAKLVKVNGIAKAEGAWKNYEIKASAMIQCSFTEFIYLDSDNVPLRTLKHLFNADLYTENGRAAFWPDIGKDHADNAVWRVIGDTCSLKEWTFESGQIVMDKRGNGGLNLAALYLAAGMMHHEDFWFKLCGGDKDTFRWAFRALDIPYTPAPRWLSALGFENQHDDGRFCGHTMLQYDLVTPPGAAGPRPLFVHSNLLKHLEGTLPRGGGFTHIKHMAIDKADDQALNYAHMYVYRGPGRGMCTDMELFPGAETGLSAAQAGEQHPVVELVADTPEFDGFEEGWWEDGGRVGGW